MQRTTKILLAISIVAASSLLSSFGFSLLGPSLGQDASWQITAWGYNLPGYDIGAPKAVDQGYRRNEPVVYYAFDQNFVGYFGESGMDALRSAFNIMNALTNADNLQLSQFPLDSQQSFDASAMFLTDLKSATLGELVEQMGLAQSVRYTWDVHDRYTPPGASCSTNPAANGELYLVTERNIDPINQVYSPYVDGTLYGYLLLESCGNIDAPPDDRILGLTIDSLSFPEPVDTTALDYEPVAEAPDVWAKYQNAFGALQDGHYYTGLTYDDAGGLHYLYSTNNIDYESPAPGSQLEVTNSQSQLLETMDLRALYLFAQTNPPAAVQAAFPNIVINSFSTYYTINTNPVVFSYFTNYIGAPAGSPAVLVVGTNGFTYTPQTNYVYSFGNLVYVDYSSNTVVTVVTTSLGQKFGEPVGFVQTNVATQTIILTNQPSGDYFILPAGSCGFNIVQTNVTFVTVVSNLIAVATNTATTNQNGFVGSEYSIYFLTNNFLTYFACDLQTSGPALYEGIGKVTFVEADYDSLIGQTFQPVTTNYSMVTITNGQRFVQYFQRTITTPDMLMDAADEDSPNVTQIGSLFPYALRTISYQEDPEVPGSVEASGPGTITDYPTTFTFNDDGPIFLASGNNVNGYFNDSFLGVGSFPLEFAWGSFDASTNLAMLYPVGTSTTNFANELVLQITPATLPDATNGVPYSQTFQVSGGGGFTAPYSWSLGTNSWLGIHPNQALTAVPAGLNLSSGGTISGTPTNNAVGPYDFVIKMTDYNGRGVTWNYTINIDQ